MQLKKEFIAKMKDLLGDEYEQFEKSLEEPEQKAITVNSLRLNNQDIYKIADFHLENVEEVQNGYYVNNIKIGSHKLSHMGVIYSQEPSAMYPVEMLDIKEGEIVLDLCSAPGGKSIQVLEKLGNTGFLVSNEIVFNRAKILYENLNRMGFKNFAITCNSPEDFEKTNLKFDKILVDAPCGGEGMFRKNNFDFDAYNNGSIDTNAKRQSNILNSIKNLLKPNGKLVYSTCTYDKRENEDVVCDFLNNNINYSILDYPSLNNITTAGITTNQPTQFCKRRYPHKHRGEGQFMALLKNNSDNIDDDKISRFRAKGYESIYKKDVEILRKTFKGIADISKLEITKRNDNFYVIPDINIDFENLNVVSIGVLMGTLSKGIFKIAHEFYHSYSEIFYNKFELNDIQLESYLQGYEIDVDDDIQNGICVVTHKNIAISGGKVVNGKLKNYYPKNLRNN